MAGWSQLSWKKKTESIRVLWCALSIIWTYNKKTWGLNTLSWGKLESQDTCLSTPVSVPRASGSFASSLDFGLKPGKPWLQSASVGQMLPARALLGAGLLSLLQLSLLTVWSYSNLSDPLIQGSHQAQSPEKIGPKPTLFGVRPGSRKEHFRSFQTRTGI